ncbi:MAG TPA: SRPBCC domain-containing protein [Afifellaceae bacterium]|nr:SRPBCC domain-containing protein [Afifellaceae bacterium]
MKFDITFDRIFPHRLEKVWQAVTDRTTLSAWLMETDFVPEGGREFQMWCDDGEGGEDRHLCRVLDIEPPNRMLWSWVLRGRQGDGETIVEFVLEEVADGTRLTIRHRGDRDPDTIERFKSGWPYKLEQLATVFDRPDQK